MPWENRGLLVRHGRILDVNENMAELYLMLAESPPDAAVAADVLASVVSTAPVLSRTLWKAQEWLDALKASNLAILYFALWPP